MNLYSQTLLPVSQAVLLCSIITTLLVHSQLSCTSIFKFLFFFLNCGVISPYLQLSLNLLRYLHSCNPLLAPLSSSAKELSFEVMFPGKPQLWKLVPTQIFHLMGHSSSLSLQRACQHNEETMTLQLKLSISYEPESDGKCQQLHTELLAFLCAFKIPIQMQNS